MIAKCDITQEIIIDRNACKGCHLCIDQCPEDVLEVSQNRSSKGYIMPAVARIDDCSACMMCEMICPDLAITAEGVQNEK